MNSHYLNKHIILGITGGIAAYKSADLVRKLREIGADVRVVMTENAKKFITPLTLQALSNHPVHDDLFDLTAEAAMGHIELARWADIVLIAPASANFLARLQSGDASDLLTTLCLATKAPLAIAPAMNQGMWHHPTVQETIASLRLKNIQIWGPAEGAQACGDTGFGRLLEPAQLIDHLLSFFQTGALSGKKVVITAGPTQESIDPIRFISNRSSGKMGYALAQAAVEAGARVVLISGPVHLPKPSHLTYIDVITAEDMLNAVFSELSDCDIFLSVAAVSDYRCTHPATQKLSKATLPFALALEHTPDIISRVTALPNKPFTVGFAAQTENVLEYARKKYHLKKMDMIIANQVGQGQGIEQDDNTVTVLWGTEEHSFPLMRKTALARELITLISQQFHSQIPS